jgi:kumamolisin
LSGGRITLGASRAHIPASLGAKRDPDPSACMEATIIVRRRPDSGSSGRVDAILRGEAPAMSREEATASLGADPKDFERVMEFATAEGLTLVESDLARRSIRVAGTAAQMEAAFGTRLRSCEIAGREYICYEGALSIPAELEGVIVAVLGLDQRPVARR